jgi:hypothetical protein
MIHDYWRYDGLAQPLSLDSPPQIEEARPWRDQLPPVHVSNTTAAGPFASAASHRSRS